MIVYLDTNVYISAKYIFDSDKLGTLKTLMDAGKITMLYTSALIGEVKQHIKDDISLAVKKHNRVLKDMPVLYGGSVNNLTKLDENQVINSVIAKLDEFIGINGVQQISLNPLDAENLLDDYFNQRPPFESKKPNEFKDAIMINAIKRFQLDNKEQICIVSNDEGFRKSFLGDSSFVIFKFLGDFLKYYNQSEKHLAFIFDFISEVIDQGYFDKVIKEYLLNFDIDRSYYEEWHYDNVEINELYFELSYIEEKGGKYVANISTDVEMSIDITYRDEDNSYYDKEEESYLVENFIHAIEKHSVLITIAMECDIENLEENLFLKKFYVVEDKRLKCINLDEDTMIDSEEIANTLQEEPDLEYCSECGALLGRTPSGAYSDYYGNPLCSNCAVSNNNGEICPNCGRKVPHKYMNSGFCKDCESKAD